MGAQGHIDREAGAHIVAEDLRDFTNGFGAARRTLHQLDHNDRAHTRLQRLFRRNKNVKAETAVVRHDKARARIGEVTADDLVVARFQHAHDARFAASFAIGAQRLRQDNVAVHTHFHLLGREIEVILLALYAQKAVAVAVADDLAAQQIKPFRQRIALATGKDQLAVALHGAQTTTQRFQVLFVGEVQFLRQLVAAGRFFAFFQMSQNKFTARNRVFIFFSFSLLKRIV